ncbi:MAG: hypothetical protein RBU36_15105, partial [Thermoanaerobaculia bacterium]|nr:hypothetical protein [Thermoanaerobaculia bacterium]
EPAIDRVTGLRMGAPDRTGMTAVMAGGREPWSPRGAMKSVLRALPVVLSALVLAAHFYRSRSLALVALSLALPLLLLVKERWSARVVQAGLVLGALEWVRTLAFFAGQRMEAGRPWARLAVILGVVAVLTALSALAVKVPRAAVPPATGREPEAAS